MRNAYTILVGNPEGKRPLGRPRSRWEDNIKMYLREIGFVGVDWTHLAMADFCEHCFEPSGSVKCFSRRS
jgi:hypothetical protein